MEIDFIETVLLPKGSVNFYYRKTVCTHYSYLGIVNAVGLIQMSYIRNPSVSHLK